MDTKFQVEAPQIRVKTTIQVLGALRPKNAVAISTHIDTKFQVEAPQIRVKTTC
jgi:hypothetical protein